MAADYFSPTDLDEALELLQSRPMSIVAGGTDFFPLRGREPVRTDLLDVTRLHALGGILWTDADTLRIGAAATWADVVNADLPAAFAGLQAAGREVGSVQIQNAGTIAGNMCNASPAADGLPPLLTLDAEIEIAGSSGVRRLALNDFVEGPRKTVLAPGELVVAFHIPRPPAHTCSAFEKVGSRKYLVISIAMTAVVVGLDDAGLIDHARVAVGACSPVAQRLLELEKDMLGMRPQDVDATHQHLAPLSPISDVRADAVYRLEAVPHQICRAIQAAVAHHG